MGLRDEEVDKLRGAVLAEDTFAGRFELIAEAGRGGMGLVFEAIARDTGARVAVRLLAAGADRARFAAEAEILERLDHPAIVKYIRHGLTTRDEPYLTMAWLAGESLASRLDRGRMPVVDVVTLGERLAGALAHAHDAGVVHRDLKPSNVFLVDDRVERACVIDFGIAKLANRDLTRTGQLVGTPGYMAPEQARGERGVDQRVDLFALGCVLYEALAGRRPFEGAEIMEMLARLLLEEPPRLDALVPEVPPRLAHLIEALLAKDAAQRPADAELVRVELAAIGSALERGDEGALALGATSIPTPVQNTLAAAVTVDERPRGPRRRRGVTGAVGAIGAVVALAAIAGTIALTRSGAPAPCTLEERAGCAARCDDGDAAACMLSGQSMLSRRGSASDKSTGLAAYTRGCELGAGSACGIAAAVILRDVDDGVPRTGATAEVNRLLSLGCDRDFMQACIRLAQLYATGRGELAADPARAVALYAKACAADEEVACAGLRAMSDGELGDPGTRATAAAALGAACTRRPRASYCERSER